MSDVEVRPGYIRIGRMELFAKSRGFGLVCPNCRCEIDEIGRGPHADDCENRHENESLRVNAEVYQAYERQRVGEPLPAGMGGGHENHAAPPAERSESRRERPSRQEERCECPVWVQRWTREDPTTCLNCHGKFDPKSVNARRWRPGDPE